MKKTAFVFPGQGAQKFGMGKEFYEQYKVSREIYDQASEWLNMDVPALCFEENDRLDQTHYTQIGLLVTEIALFEAIKEKGFVPSVTAGLSLGEYAALHAAGRISAKDAVCLIDKRGLFMQEAVPHGGAMAAVLGLDMDTISEICAGTEGIVEVANDNCPGQVVISGEAGAVETASVRLKEAGAKRVMSLNVSGPFHSSMMKGAGERLAEELEHVQWLDSDIPYVSNTLARYITDSKQTKDLLIRQVSESVRWRQSMELMIQNGVEAFVEIGPGKTIAGFLRRIDRKIPCINVEKPEDLEKLEVLR